MFLRTSLAKGFAQGTACTRAAPQSTVMERALGLKVCSPARCQCLQLARRNGPRFSVPPAEKRSSAHVHRLCLKTCELTR